VKTKRRTAFFAISAGTLAALIASFALTGSASLRVVLPEKRDATGLFRLL
jgi:hypothetical protein